MMNNLKKILIIEDDVDMVEAMKLMLEPIDCEIIAEFTPEKGLQSAKDHNPDLIILDVMFGCAAKPSGFHFAVEMREDKQLSSIPILMVTSVNTQYPNFNFSNQHDAEYLPVDDFIDKPAQPADLLQKAKNLLDLKVSKWAHWPETTQECQIN
jgi:DNA-binding response OmpR family regulator